MEDCGRSVGRDSRRFDERGATWDSSVLVRAPGLEAIVGCRRLWWNDVDVARRLAQPLSSRCSLVLHASTTYYCVLDDTHLVQHVLDATGEDKNNVELNATCSEEAHAFSRLQHNSILFSSKMFHPITTSHLLPSLFRTVLSPSSRCHISPGSATTPIMIVVPHMLLLHPGAVCTSFIHHSLPLCRHQRHRLHHGGQRAADTRYPRELM